MWSEVMDQRIYRLEINSIYIRNKPTGLPYFYAVYPVGLFAIIDS